VPSKGGAAKKNTLTEDTLAGVVWSDAQPAAKKERHRITIVFPMPPI
jgi:hypothetical protein